MEIKKWYRSIRLAIIKIEIDFKDKTGKEKRDMAVSLIDAFVNAPCPEFIEDKVIGLLVDFAIDLYNHQFGHGWIEKVAPIEDDEQPAT